MMKLRKKSISQYNYLFSVSASDAELIEMLWNGAIQIREKLHTYASSQLPGGDYWDPEPSIKRELDRLKPSNDLCESILGLNDHLSTAIPNLHEASGSNLVQLKKNKTIQWLEETHSNLSFHVETEKQLDDKKWLRLMPSLNEIRKREVFKGSFFVNS